MQLNWVVANETGLRAYQVEKSCNSVDYSIIGEVAAAGVRSYQYTDATLSCPLGLYRLRMEDLDGNSTYSRILAFNDRNDGGIAVTPNPVEDKMFITIGPGKEGTYEIRLTDIGGRNIYASRQQMTSGESIIINRPQGMPAGTYILSLQNAGKGSIYSYKLIFK